MRLDAAQMPRTPLPHGESPLASPDPQPEHPELAARYALERIQAVVAARVRVTPDGRLDRVVLVLRAGASAEEVGMVAAAVLAALGLPMRSGDLEMVPLPTGAGALPADGTAIPGPKPSAPAAAFAESAWTAEQPAATSAPTGGPGREEPAGQDGEGSRGVPRALLRHDLRVQRAGGRITCQVDLLHEGVLRRGEATDVDTPLGRARAGVRATLRATDGIRPDSHLELEALLFTEMFGRPQLVVSVEGVAGRDHVFLTGVVSAENSHEADACLATLRAVERWLGR